MNKLALVFSLGLVAVGSGAAWAKTPDGKPPSVETVCDNEQGAAFGLCNAYCEAMDCDSPNHHAADNGCAHVKANFERKTGRPLPCEAICPCVEILPLFADLVSGAADVEQCLESSDVISVITPQGTFAIVNSAGQPPFCSVSLAPPFIAITEMDVLICRDTLRRAAAAQGVPCVSPE